MTIILKSIHSILTYIQKKLPWEELWVGDGGGRERIVSLEGELERASACFILFTRHDSMIPESFYIKFAGEIRGDTGSFDPKCIFSLLWMDGLSVLAPTGGCWHCP